MAIDIPHIWLYLAELLSPVLKEGGFSMRELFRYTHTLESSTRPPEYLLRVNFDLAVPVCSLAFSSWSPRLRLTNV